MEVVRGHPRRVGYERVAQGVHVRTDRPLTPVERLRALAEVLPPSAVFTHLTSAAVRGWWSPPAVAQPVFVAVPAGERYPERAGLRVARLTTAPVVVRGTRRLHEHDGGVHREAGQHRRDLDRDRRLVEAGWQRCGFTAPEVLSGGARIIASADAVLHRTWEPRRLRAWQELVGASLPSPSGRARVLTRWNSGSSTGGPGREDVVLPPLRDNSGQPVPGMSRVEA